MSGKNYLYGLHTVQAALQQQPQHAELLYIQSNRNDQRLTAILALAQAAKIAVQTLSRHELDALAPQANHQGVILQCHQRNSLWTEDELEELLNQLKEPAFLLILDGVQDPHNLGACLRSANGAGVH